MGQWGTQNGGEGMVWIWWFQLKLMMFPVNSSQEPIWRNRISSREQDPLTWGFSGCFPPFVCEYTMNVHIIFGWTIVYNAHKTKEGFVYHIGRQSRLISGSKQKRDHRIAKVGLQMRHSGINFPRLTVLRPETVKSFLVPKIFFFTATK